MLTWASLLQFNSINFILIKEGKPATTLQCFNTLWAYKNIHAGIYRGHRVLQGVFCPSSSAWTLSAVLADYIAWYRKTYQQLAYSSIAESGTGWTAPRHNELISPRNTDTLTK